MAAYFIASFAVGIYYTRRAGRSTTDYFLSGRNLPWWLAGLSMVATTFSADTPLAVTELVATKGIAGNWLWWNMCIGGMLTVFFFARYWRRAEVMTDLEFIELRYSGRAARFLRGFRSIYLGLFMNTIIMGWVNVAMATVLQGMFGLPADKVFLYVAAAMIVTALYSSLSGLWGVVVTDAFQFVIAMIGCIILAIVVVNSPQVGGLSGLADKLPAGSLQFLPSIGSVSQGATGILSLTAGAFMAYIGVQWWASWYPGAEPGGGGYIAQRMMSTKNEKHSVFAVLFFQVAHYCLRPWPWILVGLSTLILYPGLADAKVGYVMAMNDFLPTGLKGLLVAAFFAAYMSTIATHLNWGTSYLVNDFWRRFVDKSNDEKRYVLVSRVMTLGIMVLSIVVTWFMSSISGAWMFIIECGAGLGLVLILRWYWWRVNAWSEIAATIAPIIGFAAIRIFNAGKPADSQIEFPDSLFIIVAFTTITWLIVTYLTPPTDRPVLESFYRRIRPGGVLWRPVARLYPDVEADRGFLHQAIAWLLGIVFVYSTLFGLGSLFFGTLSSILLWSLAAVASAISLAMLIKNSKRIRIVD
jgi:Na+/proline symporter